MSQCHGILQGEGSLGTNFMSLKIKQGEDKALSSARTAHTTTDCYQEHFKKPLRENPGPTTLQVTYRTEGYPEHCITDGGIWNVSKEAACRRRIGIIPFWPTVRGCSGVGQHDTGFHNSWPENMTAPRCHGPLFGKEY